MDGNTILYFEIKNINLIKIVTDVLAKISEDIRLNFIEKKSKNKINHLLEITCTNDIRTLFLKSKFGIEFIENLHISSSNIEFLINVQDLLNILKSIDKTDSLLRFYIENKNPDILVIEFTNGNDESDNNSNTDDTDSKKKKI